MSPAVLKYLAMLQGAVIVLIALVCLLLGYGAGRASIVSDCIKHRAFTYGDGAWGCMRLRKAVRDIGRDELVDNERVET